MYGVQYDAFQSVVLLLFDILLVPIYLAYVLIQPDWLVGVETAWH